ncbi:MAG: GNAT family N-acetyltransferase [Plesiomonas sp.]|uniref:GNAT family N-acetyltransferase n=1 Tax=Plesiomonas sp. TaxID=2486279 RepID=UPI003F3D030E
MSTSQHTEKKANITILRANVADTAKVAPLYVQYREFYHVDPQPQQAQAFLHERLEQNQSVIFYAQDEKQNTVGFTQLYPAFCSLQMKPIWYLYDLFVSPNARKQGIGEALLTHCKQFGEKTGAGFVFLQTGVENTTAQRLYEKMGYQRDTEFYTYMQSL